MKLDDIAVKAANDLVKVLDNRGVNAYVTLAKAALWTVAGVLTIVMLVAWWRFCGAGYEGHGWYFDSQAAGVVVSSAQGLMALALAVLSLHEYRGSRILHVLRHWRDKKDASPDG
jgi:hypothetical protein